MGARTTIDITRPDAIREILSRLLMANDQQIANVLEDLLDRHQLYNFSIVDDYNGTWPYKYNERGL